MTNENEERVEALWDICANSTIRISYAIAEGNYKEVHLAAMELQAASGSLTAYSFLAKRQKELKENAPA